MRKQNFVALVVLCVSLVVLGMAGCKNDLLIAPTFGNSTGSSDQQIGGASAERFGAPANLTATQGGFREITLNWSPVKDAVRYYIYRANTQFETFVQVGETGDSSTSYTMKVQAGADFYYRVTAVSHAGEESRFSTIVRGTSLAQPLVSGIEGVEGKEDSDVTVYWYMSNVDAYQDLVRYNVICYDNKGTELARVVVDGSKVKETSAVVSGLIPNTSYTYAVEAYIVSAQDKVEKCEPIDAATARRLRPNAPEELVVQQGQSKDGITLSFKLPALVDVALPGGFYDQYPLYFKIYRREASSANTDTGWQLIKSDFGKTTTKPAEDEVQKVNFGAEDVDYNPGDTVTFTDQTAGLKRGTKYEYKVQSFAYYERDITSQYSASVEIGWLIDQANFRTGKYTPTLNEEETAYVSATLGFSFEWKTMGLDDEYHFILGETRFTLEGDSTDSSSVEKETIDIKFNSIAEVNAYVREFNHLNDDTEGVNVRGYYRYTLTIFNRNNTAILVLNSPSRAVVTNSVNVPVIKLFSVSSGYNDKIELQWMHNSNYTYAVEYIDTTNTETVSDAGATVASTINHDALYNGKQGYKDGDVLTYTHEVAPGTKYEYILRVSEDIATDSLPIVGRTSVAPEITGDGYSYDSISVTWQDVPASNFTIAAKYKNSEIAKKYPINPMQADGHDAETVEKEAVIRTLTFDEPNGYTHANVSGQPVEVTITAHVPVTRTVHQLDGDVGTSYNITTEEITSLELVSTTEHNTVGPAMVEARADLGVYSDRIDLNWKEVKGANAYMVLRSGFHIASNVSGVPSDSPNHLDFKSTDMYLVKKSGDTWTVSLMPNGMSCEQYFSVSFADGTFTLSDKLYTAANSSLMEGDKETMGQWIARQEQLSWGAPYKYSVLPIITENEAIEYNYELSPSSVAVASINLTELPLVNGTTKGYAWNVKATKGTYSENGENTGVKLTWTRPFTPSEVGYNVYRAEYNTQDASAWEKLAKPVELGQTTYVDETATPGVMYQYMVATGVDTDAQYPNKNVAWVAHHDARLDDDYEGERLANGFMLPRISFSVTRSKVEHNDSTGGKERLSWTAPVIAGKANYLFNGYIIELLNHNISGEWQQIAKLDFGGSIQNLANYTHTQGNENGLLKVLRDYKHYFRIRTYTIDENGDEVVSKDDYQWADGKETDYVKWGARSLSADEWIKCTTLAMSIGLERAKNNRAGATGNDQWSASHGEGTNNESLPGSGSSSLNAYKNRETFLGIPSGDVYHKIKYNNYKPAMITKSGQKVSFLTIITNSDDDAFYGETYSGTAIRAATDFCTTGVSGDFNSTPRQITIKGPSDVSEGLYDAKIAFWKFNPVRENGGGYLRLYPGHNASDDDRNFFTRKSGSIATPFPCADNDSTFKNDEDEWK